MRENVEVVCILLALRRGNFDMDTLLLFCSCMVGKLVWYCDLLLGHLCFLDKHVQWSCLWYQTYRHIFDNVRDIFCIDIEDLVFALFETPTLMWSIKWSEQDIFYCSLLKMVVIDNSLREKHLSIHPMLRVHHSHSMLEPLALSNISIHKILIFEHLLLP